MYSMYFHILIKQEQQCLWNYFKSFSGVNTANQTESQNSMTMSSQNVFNNICSDISRTKANMKRWCLAFLHPSEVLKVDSFIDIAVLVSKTKSQNIIKAKLQGSNVKRIRRISTFTCVSSPFGPLIVHARSINSYT